MPDFVLPREIRHHPRLWPIFHRIARYSRVMDKSGLLFLFLLGALAALVVSVLLIETEQPTARQDDGSLIPPEMTDHAR